MDMVIQDSDKSSMVNSSNTSVSDFNKYKVSNT